MAPCDEFTPEPPLSGSIWFGGDRSQVALSDCVRFLKNGWGKEDRLLDIRG